MSLDTTAVVTGAARGLGRATAEALAAAGARVALVDILHDELQRTAADFKTQGLQAEPFTADTTSPGQVDGIVGRIEAALGPVGALVNNAGTFSVIAPVWQADPDKWFRDLRTNLFGSFLCCRAFVAGMVARGHGRVVNIVSSGGVGDPHPYCTSYASSKAGLMRLTEGLAAEAREHGVFAFAVAPPALKTAMTQFIVDDPGGRKWRPTFGRIFEEGRDHPPGIVADMIVRLIKGEADDLTGRFLEPRLGLDAYLARRADIVKDDLWTLRIRK